MDYCIYDIDKVKRAVNEFINYSGLLFKEYLEFASYFAHDEVVAFSRIFESSIELSKRLAGKNLVLRHDLSGLLACWKGVSRLSKSYASGTNEKEARRYHGFYVKRVERAIKEIKKLKA